jgi:hypothetical protein
MKTLQVLTVLAASAVLSTGAFAGGSSNTTVISGPLLQLGTTDAAAKALATAKGFGPGSYTTQTIGSAATPTGAMATVNTTAYGGFAASVKSKASAELTTNQVFIVGY